MGNEQTTETKQAENQSQAGMEKEFAKHLVNTFDLKEGLINAVDGSILQERQGATTEVEEEEDLAETEEAAKPEESEEISDESEGKEEVAIEDSEEELIPKSKVQKRIDDLVKQNKKFESELKAIRESQATSQSSKDADVEKLEAMNETELKALKKEIKLAQLNHVQSGGDRAKLVELMELEDKADKVLSTVPQRFQYKQIEKFNEAVSDTELDDKAKETVFGYAKTIFLSSPELQSSVTGQARAWKMATDHFTEINKLSKGKVQADELKRQNTTLKKKISVETSSQKMAQKPNDDVRNFNKAKVGTEQDKVNFFRKRMNTDSYLPEGFSQGT